MVAAWISADTGVGPSMASGSQTYSGSWADLPHAVRNINNPMAPAAYDENWCSNTTLYVSEPVFENTRNMATMSPKSATRLVTNSFLPATAARLRSNQNDTSRYEHSATPSQPRNRNKKLSASTSVTIEKTNRFRYRKNCRNRGSPFM